LEVSPLLNFRRPDGIARTKRGDNKELLRQVFLFKNLERRKDNGRLPKTGVQKEPKGSLTKRKPYSLFLIFMRFPSRFTCQHSNPVSL